MGKSDQRVVATVFCATDFSETADLAIRHASSLARRHEARLVLGHIVEPLPADPYPMPVALSENERNIQQLAFERLADRAASIEESGIQIDTRLDRGPCGPLIVERAVKEEADLIVVGTRGLTGFKHLVFGSTAEYVVRRAACPVLTVHPNDREPTDSFREVILPTDLSPGADVAAEALLALYSDVAPPRVLLAFADSSPPYLEAIQHEQLAQWNQPDVRRQELEQRLEPMAQRLRAQGFEVEPRVLDGGAVEAITELAQERGSDLIMLSTHGRSALMNALLGRTAQRIVQHACCPVLTVRPPHRG
ncbi:MAG: universal stress protein [bacterium]|nr:universal stress protein [bacterium]